MELDGDRIVVTKASVAPPTDFDAFAEQFAERGISRDDVDDAIRWARKRS